MRTIKNFNFDGQRVLVRCDFNAPLDKEGNILDDFRIKQAVPTIQYLAKNGAKLILMSHLDGPGGTVKEELRLTPIQNVLTKYLALPVIKVSDCLGKETESQIKEMQKGEILLLENLRFYKGEEENSKEFARELAKLGDIFINDAFGVCHRSHASITGLAEHLPAGAGFLLEKEVKILADLMENPLRPLVAIIGGKKAKNKTKVIEKILRVADFVLIGHLIENEIKEKVIFFENLPRDSQKIIVPLDSLGRDGRDLDIGPKTIKLFEEKISQAGTIFWNGPLGMTEEKEFSNGSEKIAQAIVRSKSFSVVGGGETAEFVKRIGLEEEFSHLSTGGGALLEFLAGEKLPGLEALGYYENKKH